MGQKHSKKDVVEEIRVQQLPTPEDKEKILADLEGDPQDANLNVDYAVYLAHCEKKYEEAEQYFIKAMELDAYSIKPIGHYALFLEITKKQVAEAGVLYKKAYDEIICRAQALGDNEVNFMCNYAIYLKNVLQKMDSAEAIYKRLIASNPNHAIAHGDYGILLKDVVKDYEKAGSHLKRAAELDPHSPHWLLAYANYLKYQKKDKKTSKQYYKTVKALNKKSKKKS